MKKIIILLTALISFTLSAQDKIYVHEATPSNITAHVTYIDHPDLNNNPNAELVFKHVWNPNGSGGVYNDNMDGLWYDSSVGKWTIFNEDFSPMVVGAQFFIYIASNSSDVITHITSATNTTGSITLIDDPDFNGVNPGPYAIISNYWNPNGVYNTLNYGFWFDTTENKRSLFSQNGISIPIGAAFKILKNGTGTISRFNHQATTSNVINNYTVIDNINLNNNPNASFVFEHYWGINGAGSQVEINKKLSVWYNGANWSIYTEDQSPMPVGVAFDIIVVNQEVLSIEDNTLQPVPSIYPNPAKDYINITTNVFIKKVEIFNLLGQKVKSLDINSNLNSVNISISELQMGSYIVKVQIQNGSNQTLKLIKQ